MTLNFLSTQNDYVNFGNSAEINNLNDVGTFAGWFYRTSAAGDSAYFYKLNSAYTNGISMKAPGVNGLGLRLDVPMTGTSLRIQTNSSVVTLNAWNFVCATWDTSSPTATDQKLFVGTLTSPVSEISSYNFQIAGSGSVNNADSDGLGIGNIPSNPASFARFVGNIGWVGFWSTQLTQGQLRKIQYKPTASANCVLSCWFGKNGSGTQTDLSGEGNHGTITGATVSSRGLPLINPFFFEDSDYFGRPGVLGHPISAPHVPLPFMEQSNNIIVPTSSSSIKTIKGLTRASVKTINDLAIASVKTVNGLT